MKRLLLLATSGFLLSGPLLGQALPYPQNVSSIARPFIPSVQQYISAFAGIDNGACLSSTSPCATDQYAANALLLFDLKSQQAQINNVDVGPTITASISGTVLTVTNVAASTVSGVQQAVTTLKIGSRITASGVTLGSTIISLGTGTGGNGTYNLSISSTVSSESMTASAVYDQCVNLIAPLTGSNQQYAQIVFSGQGMTKTSLAPATVASTGCVANNNSPVFIQQGVAAIQSMTVTGYPGAFADLWESNTGRAYIGVDTAWNGTPISHFHSEGHGQIESNNSWTQGGQVTQSVGVSQHGLFEIDPSDNIVITLEPGSSFINAWGQAQDIGQIYVGTTTTISGTATGPRYLLIGESELDNPDAITLPGNSAGINKGGWYVTTGSSPRLLDIQLQSNVATGTAPFIVASTTNVANLNASSLSGNTFAAPGPIGGTTPAAITGTTITANTSVSTPSLITASGNLTVTPASGSGVIQVYQGQFKGPTFQTFEGSNAPPAGNIIYDAARGTLGSPTIVANSDDLWRLFINGYDGASYQSAVEIQATATGTPASGIIPGQLTFLTANTSGTLTSALRIDNAQNVILGGTSGSLKAIGGTFTDLVTVTGGASGATISTNAGTLTINSGSSSNLTDATINMVNIAQTSAAQTGTVCRGTAGLLTYDATLGCLASSARFKTAIKPLNGALEEVMRFNPVSFQYINRPEDPAVQVGLIAEEVNKVDPRLVGYEPDGVTPRGVRYAEYTALLTKALQEQQLEIEALKQGQTHTTPLWCRIFPCH